MESRYPSRYLSAMNESHRPPGKWEFWKTATDQVDLFAYRTAMDGKGGPFGSSLYVYHAPTERYVLIGGGLDSNAVVSKGIASAHAEAENLSPKNRNELARFLRSDQDHQRKQHPAEYDVVKDYAVVQVSSGESCPSCRSKQIAFAEELYNLGLLKPQRFFVVFKACYERTFLDAGFNDAPYDMLFRVLNHEGLSSTRQLDDVLVNNQDVAGGVERGDICPASVKNINLDDVPKIVAQTIDTKKWTVGCVPFAIIVNKNHSKILAAVADSREPVSGHATPTNGDKNSPESIDTMSSDEFVSSPSFRVNDLEGTCVQSAIAAAAKLIRKEGCFESWDLQEAEIYTNLEEIGPVALGDSMWANISTIHIVSELVSDKSKNRGREVPHLTNWDLLKKCAQEYNTEDASIQVTFCGTFEGPSVAHLFWKAKIMQETLEQQTEGAIGNLVDNLVNVDGSPTNFGRDEGSMQKQSSSHYNGKSSPAILSSSPHDLMSPISLAS